MFGFSPEVFQGAGVATFFVALVGALVWYIKGMADRGRVQNEALLIKSEIGVKAKTLQAKIEEDLREEAIIRFQEFRDEVHALRNELAATKAELHLTTTKSVRRGDKLNMLLFILRLVMDELYAKDPSNKVLEQARKLLARIEDEPHVEGNSNALNAAEDTVVSANKAVREVKADEALHGKGPK